MSNIVRQTRSGRKSEVEIQRRLGGFIYLRRRLSAFGKGAAYEFDISNIYTRLSLGKVRQTVGGCGLQ